jgi:copper chaperone
MKIQIKAKGMHCKSCDMLIEDSMSDLDGVINCKSSFEKQIVDVEFDEKKVTLDQIKKVIVDEGYEVE